MKKILLIAASALMICGCNDNVEVIIGDQCTYRVTVFVREVLDDGTLSYTRTYITKGKPIVGYRNGVVELNEGIVINAPYIIERVRQTEH